MLGKQRSIPRRTVLLGILLAFSTIGQAEIIVSTTNKAVLDGLRIWAGESAEYDPLAAAATLFLSEHPFSRKENIDALHVLDNGHIILSTKNKATLGGLWFRAGDLVEYDPVAGTATLFLSGDIFSRRENIDAVCVLDDGNIILSTRNKARLGGLAFRDGDLVKYDPVAGTARLFLSERLFSRNEDIDAVHILSNGDVVLSTASRARLGGLRFRDGDLVRYNPVAGTAALFFTEDLFSRNEDIDAATNIGAEVGAPPEPASLFLLVAGGLALLRRRTRARV